MRTSEEFSSLNLLHNKQEFYFQQPFANSPLKLTQCRTKMNTFGHKQNKSNIGEYQQYKLTNYLRQMSNADDSETTNSYNRLNMRNSKVIDVVTIDDSVIKIGQQFGPLMLKYISNEVVFVAVSGQKQAGKSFFCDKLLNLAEVKGNNFSQKRYPGLHAFSTPFMKDDLCIFLLEVSGCEISTDMFKYLNMIAMTLSSSYIFIADKNNACWDSFQQSLQASKNLLSLDEQSLISSTSQLLPNTLYFVSRNKQLSNIELKSNLFFKQIQTFDLTDAMAVGYTGKRQDLPFLSFLSKQFINPQYIKEVYSIFMTVYRDIEGKKCEQLIVRGSIINKILLVIVTNLNANKPLSLSSIYQNVAKQLYVTAFNYCVMIYHDELQKQFENEQPKSTDNMYKAFEKASMSALQKFNEYNMNEELHKEFQQKLINHIEQKQSLICSINKEKTQELLREHFSKNVGDVASIIQMMKTYRKQLDDGRIDVIQQTVQELIKRENQGGSKKRMKKLKQLKTEKQQLQNKCQQVIDKRKAAEDKNLTVQKKYKELQVEEENLDKQISKTEKQISFLAKKQKDLENGETDSMNQMRKELTKLRNQQQSLTETLNGLRSAVNQPTDDYQERINSTINQQKLIQKQLQQLKKNSQASNNKPHKKKSN